MTPLHSTTPQDRLIRKLETVAELTDLDRAAIRALPVSLRSVTENTDVVSQYSRPSECSLVVEGFVCRYVLLPDGGRQIHSFHIAGDMPDLCTLFLPVMDHGICALTPTVIGCIPHSALRAAIEGSPTLTAALWRDTLVDGAIFRAWLGGVGRKSAKQRIAHLFCEQVMRHRAIGLVDAHAIDLPLTQTEMADALGLSSVHVNRVLQELRSDGLIGTRGPLLSILNWQGLIDVAEFEPVYLHQRVRLDG